MFADIYGHLLIAGVSFEEIADFMMSPIINVVARFTRANMFDPITGSITLKNVIQFVKNENTLGSVNSFELNNMLNAWWRGSDGKITDKSFLPKLVYEVSENGELKKDKNGNLIPRKKVITAKLEGKTVQFTPEILATFFETVNNNGKFTLSEKAKKLRESLNDLLLDNNICNILLQHILYLRNKSKEFAPVYMQNEDNDNLDIDFDVQVDDLDYDDFDYDSMHDLQQRKRKSSEDIDPTKITNGKLSEQNYNIYLRYIDYYVRLRNDLLNREVEINGEIIKPITQIKKLDFLLNEILPATEEQRILGSMLGANQGLKTNNYDLYSFGAKISTFINKRYNEYNSSKKDKLDTFNLIDFISNEYERAKQIKQYEKVKSKINILDTISSVAHFKEMFDMSAIGEALVNQAAKNRFERSLISKILPDNTLKLSEPEFKILQKYTSQIFSLNWILNQNFEINIPEGEQYYDKENFVELVTVPKGSVKLIKLNNAEGIATFKHWMDDYVIPTLRRSKIASGAFISSLTYQMVPSKLGGMMSVFKFAFNPMLVTDNPTLELQWSNIVNNFNDIAESKLSEFGIDSDLNIMDAFYLYNTITFGDGISQHSLTKLFEDINLKYESSLVNNYNEWLSKLDSGDISLNDLKYNIVDLFYMLSTQSTSELKFGITSELNKEGKVKKINLKSGNKTTSISVNKEHSTDFTYDLPIQLEYTNEPIDDKIEAYTVRQEQKMVRYELDSRDVILTIIQSLQSKFKGAKIHTIDNGTLTKMRDGVIDSTLDLTNFDRMINAKAFINNGEVYINLDNATAGSAFHEYMHIAAACLKFNDDQFTRELYYNLLDKVQELYKNEFPNEYKEISEKYSSLNGSDFNEELLVRLLEARFTKRLRETWGVAKDDVESLDTAVEAALQNVLELNSGEGTINISRLSISKIDDILRYFNSSLYNFNTSGIGIDQIRKSEELMTLKRKLVELGELTYDKCK